MDGLLGRTSACDRNQLIVFAPNKSFVSGWLSVQPADPASQAGFVHALLIWLLQSKAHVRTVVGGGQAWAPWQQRFEELVLFLLQRCPRYAVRVGVSCSAADSVIRKAFREASDRIHPNSKGHQGEWEHFMSQFVTWRCESGTCRVERHRMCLVG